MAIHPDIQNQVLEDKTLFDQHATDQHLSSQRLNNNKFMLLFELLIITFPGQYIDLLFRKRREDSQL